MEVRAAIDRYDKKLSKLLEPCLQSPWLSACMRVVSASASGFSWFPIYAALYFLTTSDMSLVKTLVIGEGLQLPVIIILRHFTKRPRPRIVDRSDYSFVWNRYSFPSLHTSRACMLGGIMFSLYPWALPWLIISSLLIACSRLVLQKHYLSDILCGAMIGTFSALVALSLKH